MTHFSTFKHCSRLRVADSQVCSVLSGCEQFDWILVLVWPQLGDFDSLEYAWWLRREWARLCSYDVEVRAIAIGDQASGEAFCEFTGFPQEKLFIDPTAELHQQLKLYKGLDLQLPGLSVERSTWLNLLLMCAGIGSPGTLSEVFRGYRGDRKAPQLIGPDEWVEAPPLPPLQGKVFNRAGGSGFQRPFELATLRLKNMVEVLTHWKTYVPNATYLTQRGGTFLFNADRELVYEHQDPGILGFSETMNNPLEFLWTRL